MPATQLLCNRLNNLSVLPAQALLVRLEAKVLARSGITDIAPLMKRLFPRAAKAGAHLERYPARVFLCAYMVLSHPKVVFNTQGELEDMLAAAGKTMLTAFEALLEQLAEPIQVTDRSVYHPTETLCCHVQKGWNVVNICTKRLPVKSLLNSPLAVSIPPVVSATCHMLSQHIYRMYSQHAALQVAYLS